MRIAIVAFSLVLVVSTAQAQEIKRVGPWTISIMKDRFGGSANVVALAPNRTGAFAIRCVRETLSFGYVLRSLRGEPNKVGDHAFIKVRADDKPVIDTIGRFISDSAILIGSAKEIATSLSGAKEVALRVTLPSVSFDDVFKFGSSGGKALAEVLRECPIEKIKTQ
jgi:hypothetical protein